jgi:HEAT repeat protein
MGPLEKILDHPDKELAERLLSLLGRLKGERANRIFLKMIEHPSGKVRAQAVKILMVQDPKIIAKLFFLIDDPFDEVRQEVLAAIAEQKSTVVENLLLKYMKENFEQKEPEHILACYEALGGCGSVTAIQFLKRILLGQGWNRFTGFGKELHRQGAATALAVMNTWETKDILLEASKSRYQVIRQGFQKAMVRIDVLRGNS